MQGSLGTPVICRNSKQGGQAAFIMQNMPMIHLMLVVWVNIENLLISQPDNGEQAPEIAETLARSSAVDIIVVDSVAAPHSTCRN